MRLGNERVNYFVRVAKKVILKNINGDAQRVSDFRSLHFFTKSSTDKKAIELQWNDDTPPAASREMVCYVHYQRKTQGNVC